MNIFWPEDFTNPDSDMRMFHQVTSQHASAEHENEHNVDRHAVKQLVLDGPTFSHNIQTSLTKATRCGAASNSKFRFDFGTNPHNMAAKVPLGMLRCGSRRSPRKVE
ncbi:hypothetical protein RvY_13806 [Ramazzottius varieornatus]|uniref:Uncharacterized protein n=1 Tax=Ramazzottius varieornatus TaxID=947166 RepID=A0A1D1VP68_RAMVA|nr:hypothetical protein RvY_13806 [Ramazzottius varieornatus]